MKRAGRAKPAHFRLGGLSDGVGCWHQSSVENDFVHGSLQSHDPQVQKLAGPSAHPPNFPTLPSPTLRMCLHSSSYLTTPSASPVGPTQPNTYPMFQHQQMVPTSSFERTEEDEHFNIDTFRPMCDHRPTPPLDFSKFSLANALTLVPSFHHEPPLTILHYNYDDFTSADSEIFNFDVSRESHAPLRRPIRNTRTARIHPVPYSSSSPAAVKRMNVYPPVITPSPTIETPQIPVPEPILPLTTTTMFVPTQYTGDWETDELIHRTARRTDNVSQLSSTLTIDTTGEVPPAHRLHVSDRSARPYVPTKPRMRSPPSPPSPSPSPEPAEPSPRKRAKQQRDENGKPLMACLFCRGRKIACGAPPPGITDPTCNQCSRRGLTCTYPTENRRGQRKYVKADTPKKCSSSSRKGKAKAVQVAEVDVSDSESSDSESEWDGYDV